MIRLDTNSTCRRARSTLRSTSRQANTAGTIPNDPSGHQRADAEHVRLSRPRSDVRHRNAFSSTACLIQLFRLTPCAVAESAARWCRSGRSCRLRVPENGPSARPRLRGTTRGTRRWTARTPAESRRRGRLERRDGVGAAVDDPAVKTADGVVELDGGHVALVLDHDCTPAALGEAERRCSCRTRSSDSIACGDRYDIPPACASTRR